MTLSIRSASLFQPARAATSQPMLSRGSTGAAVSSMQRLLSQAGFSPGPIDGQFGPLTQAAVRRFQAARGLAVDGIVGPNTWGALTRATPAPPTSGGGGTPVLRSGDMGPDVAEAQQLLTRHGFNPQGIDGQFGPNTRRAVVEFQREKGLAADGVIGPRTWAELNKAPSVDPTRPDTNTLRQRMLEVARGELGTVEATNNNDGAVLKYPSSFGRGREACCADFVSWVARHSGGRMNDPYCPSVVNSLKAQGTWKGRSNPQPGDLVLFDWNGDRVADHIGIVEHVNGNGTITTLEGNTENPSTGRQGVWRRERVMGDVLGFGAPY